ncbi:MAG: hypothetical protein NC429_16565 [Lachnospiraceae bacterium]|nr:hypothetical protein [Lachnospiraceae bacterium]
MSKLSRLSITDSKALFTAVSSSLNDFPHIPIFDVHLSILLSNVFIIFVTCGELLKAVCGALLKRLWTPLKMFDIMDKNGIRR